MKAIVGLLLLATMSAAAAADRAPAQAVPADLPLGEIRVVGEDAFLRYARAGHPDADEIYLRTLYRYYREACAAEGVSLVVALAQMIHETDYLRFTGSVRAVQYNYAGLGATSPGNPGLRFANMRVGVSAHVQHIKAYANRDPLATALVDPRFHLVERGSAPTVSALTGRWATDPDYARKVMAHVLRLLALDT